jgi:hypothetical protein
MGLTAGSAHKIRALLSRLCIFCSGSDLSSCSTACSSFCRRSVRARSSPPTPATTSTSALWASPSPRCVSARLEEHAIAMLLLSVPGPTCVPSGRNSTRMRFSRSSRGIHSGGNALVLPALFFQEDCPGDSWLVDVRLWHCPGCGTACRNLLGADICISPRSCSPGTCRRSALRSTPGRISSRT